MGDKVKKVYIGMSADVLHHGHINLLKIGKKLGEITVGLLTDKAILSYKKKSFLSYKQRETVIKSIKYVNKIVPQKTLDYRDNLKKIKPDFVVHGDDWKTGAQKKTREQVLDIIKNWGGKLIEPRYTKKVSSRKIKKFYSLV